MTRNQLAARLRRRQLALRHVPAAMVAALSDDEILDAYVTCSGCGERLLGGAALEAAIATSDDADQFFRACEARTRHDHGGPKGGRS